MKNEHPRIGEYEHSKSKGRYKVIGTGTHSETKEEFVVYEALYGDHLLWIRPLSMFIEEIEVDGQKVPRFKFIGEENE